MKQDSKVRSWVPGSKSTKAFYKKLARKQERIAEKRRAKDGKEES